MSDMQDCCLELDADIVFSITGGDPLTHPEIWNILKEARVFVKKLAVLGNPELLNEKSVAKLKEIGINWFQVSLDGMKETHDNIRSVGSFERTINGIELLKNANIPIVVNSTVSDLNYREMIDVMKLSYDLGVGKWSFARWVPNSGTCGISAKEYRNFLNDIHREQESYTHGSEAFLSVKTILPIFRLIY